jgi:hypothetical protein
VNDRALVLGFEEEAWATDRSREIVPADAESTPSSQSIPQYVCPNLMASEKIGSPARSGFEMSGWGTSLHRWCDPRRSISRFENSQTARPSVVAAEPGHWMR